MNLIPIPETVIVDTSHSPFAQLKPISMRNITMEEGFWHSRIEQNVNVTIPSQYLLLEKTGRLDNFRRITGEVQKPYQGYVFNDSDVYKWLEAASWSWAYHPDGQLGDWMDQVITLIANAQDKDGYLNTYFSLEKIRQRWMNLQEKHELYCAGHLIQAAIAHYRSTGESRLINVAVRLADHICNTFGPSQVEGTCGHPEIEMALIELYRVTGDEEYRDQAALFIDRRGRGLLGGSEYLLDHVPFRQMNHLAGHAVRALYLCSGATDLALETGEEPLVAALERLWKNMVTQQMYITGGAGARHEGEAFGAPYELPNARAYAETCAAIANVMWNWRMLLRQGNAQYADLMEWALYNAVLPGISQDGGDYFYVNPLVDAGTHRRVEWFDCACCPPNIARTIAAIPGYLYSISPAGIWVNLYASSKSAIILPSGLHVKLEQATSYPWDGKIILQITEISAEQHQQEDRDHQKFSVFLRLPAWMDYLHAEIKLNGRLFQQNSTPGTYLEIQRRWKKGDRIDINLPMEVRFLESHPSVVENNHRIAITRGPLVYCLESADNPGVDLSNIRIDPEMLVQSEYDPGLLGGITRLHFRGYTRILNPLWEQALYRNIQVEKDRERSVDLISVPYFAWANRQPGKMAIWHAMRS